MSATTIARVTWRACGFMRRMYPSRRPAQSRRDAARTLRGLLSLAEYRHAVGRADEDHAVGYRRCDELVAGAEVVATAGGLRTVVKLMRQVRRVVGVQHRGATVRDCPDDSIGSAVGGNCRRRAGIGKLSAALRCRQAGNLCASDGERFQSCTDLAVIERSVEIGRCREDAVRKETVQLLPDGVAR